MSAPEAGADHSKSIMLRLFAVAVLLVGGLDMMLAWRRGLEASGFYVILFIIGIVLYAASWILQSANAANEGQGSIDMEVHPCAPSGDKTSK